jgi:2-C-methyl-D-erythritol 4-phosphate cytidylyltransferase
MSDLIRLLTTLESDPVGGLLAARVTDTIKRASVDGRVHETVPRTGLWRALTPQQFRYGILLDAMAAGLSAQAAITDEASAMELAGHSPRLVEGRSDNIKITVPEDLTQAGWVLQQMEKGD